MEKIKAIGTLTEVESLERQGRNSRSSGLHEDLRSLEDNELLLVGGGDDGPGWGHP